MIEALSALFAAVGLGLVAIRHRSVPVVASVVVAVALVSLAVTLEFVADDRVGWGGATLVELAALVTPIVLLTRSARLTVAIVLACVLAGLTEGALALRYTGDLGLLESLAVTAFWSLPAAGAAAAGLYLRALDARRRRAVAEVRHSQRMALAHDLHDFVAHDVTAVVVQAQAARTVADRQPERAAIALGASSRPGCAR